MDALNLPALADELLAEAQSASSGRATRVIQRSDTGLRQLVLALATGQGLGDHQNPGHATLQVIRGAVTLSAGEESWSGESGDYLIIPLRTHDLNAHEDSVVMLTFVTA
ncbi:cupin domain-containing protein [Janibacter sp. GXQ6167]|uniref:cupin domain-containing protein n=1 Tax=Janibacter sp. GXQ6167 TaxID=3240791 RepID=UPI003525F5B9